MSPSISFILLPFCCLSCPPCAKMARLKNSNQALFKYKMGYHVSKAQFKKIRASLENCGVGRRCSVRHQWMVEWSAWWLTSRSASCRGHWCPTTLLSLLLFMMRNCAVHRGLHLLVDTLHTNGLVVPLLSHYHCTPLQFIPMSCSHPPSPSI